MRAKIFNTLGYLLCELAFKTDCWGPFGWCYRAGCWCYGMADWNVRIHFRRAGLAPVHPGEIIREDILPALGMQAKELAAVCGAPIEQLVAEEISVSPEIALNLAKYFETTPGFWLALQEQYDREKLL